jgi:hypothetical protein
VNALQCLTGQMGTVEATPASERCAECDRLWREYRYAARSYASIMHAQHVLIDDPRQALAVLGAMHSAATAWAEARAALTSHGRMHGSSSHYEAWKGERWTSI